MFRFKSRAGCVWDLALRRGTAENKVRTHSQITGLTVEKQIQSLDSPLEIFVICAQGVCSFFRTPRERHTDKGTVLMVLLFSAGTYIRRNNHFRWTYWIHYRKNLFTQRLNCLNKKGLSIITFFR